MMRKENAKTAIPKAGRTAVLALLTATALSGCAQLKADLQAAFKPRVELLSEIEQDLYRAILASDKIEKLRMAPLPKTKATASKAKADTDAELAETKTAEVDLPAPAPEAPVQEAIYLSQSEVSPVKMTFQGDAGTFFKKIAEDIDYDIVEEGGERTVDLNIKANGEPLFGVAIRAANYVEQDMNVRFDMEKKIIRIQYLDG